MRLAASLAALFQALALALNGNGDEEEEEEVGVGCVVSCLAQVRMLSLALEQTFA